jgi:gliding motility-associated-like protein/uncharacterized repeat protein (TIGR01451 family)
MSATCYRTLCCAIVAVFMAAGQLFALDNPGSKDRKGKMAEMVGLANPSNTAEGSNTYGGIDVVVSGAPAPEDISVTFTVTGKAVAGTDYYNTGWTGSTTIFAGSNYTRISLQAINDDIVEGDEDVIITITGATGLSGGSYDLDPANGTQSLLITDNDNVVSAYGITGAQAAEPASPLTVKFALPGSLTADEDITLHYTATGTTASASDFEAPTGTIVLPAGTNSVVLTIPIVDDKIIEGNETVKITLVSASAASFAVRISENASVNCSILDDDSELSISVGGTINGREFPNSPGRFTITLPPGVTTSKIITVRYTVTGTATSGLDFNPLTGTAFISASKGSTNVIISVINDNVIEDLENVVITLISGSSADLATFAISPTNGVTTISITDDDNVAANRQINAIKVADGSESAGDGSFKLALPGLYTYKQDMTVTYTVSGTATPGADYTPLSGSATLVGGQNSVLVTVPVLNDALIEGDEKVIITPQPVTVGADNFSAGTTDTVMILDDDDDNLRVGVTTADRDASETGDTAAFKVSLPDGTAASAPVTVNYTIDGVAANGTDYISLPGTIVIPADSNSMYIPVSAIDDNLVEGDENLSITLTGVSSTLPFTIDQDADTASATIHDDDNVNMDIVVGIGIPAGAEPATAGEFTVGLASAKVTTVPITVTYHTAGTATSGTDYTTLSGTVTIPAGSSSAPVSVPVLDDDLIEGDETAVLIMDNVTSSLPFVAGAQKQDTVIINDDDNVNMNVVITASKDRAGEPNIPGEFTVGLASGKTTLVPITVTYTIGGTATVGNDYTVLSGTVTIPANSSSVTFPVAVLNDTIAESNETIIAQLNTVTSTMPFVKGVPDTDTVTIIDDDTEQLVIEASDADAAEPSNAGQFTVRIASGATAAADITIDLEITGTATNGTDYTTIPAAVVLPAGNSSVIIPVTVLDDNLVEGDESVAVKLINLTSTVSYNIGGNNLDTVKISDEDDDNLDLEVVATKADAAEPGTEPGNGGEFTIRLESGKVPAADINVEYTLTGSATNGTDYTTLPTTAVIPAGSSGVSIPVTIQDDPKPEGIEDIIMTLTNVSGGGAPFAIGSNAAGTVYISDNDTSLTSAWMSASHDNPRVNPGDRITYLIHISNGTDTNYNNVIIRGRVPAHTTFVLAEGGVRPDASGLLTWVISSVPAGTLTTLELRVTVANDLTGVDSIINNATIDFGDAIGEQRVRPADPLDPDQPLLTAGPDDPSSWILVNKSAGFIAWKTVKTPDNASAVKPGDELVYTIYVRNTGIGDLAFVSVSDTIPANTAFTENAVNNPDGGIYDNISNSLRWSWPVLAFGAKDSVSFTVRVADNLDGVTQITNQATVWTADSTTHTVPCEPGTAGCSGQPGLTVVPVEQAAGPVVDLKFPNVFTPNGDGLNEYFKVAGLDGLTGVELYVYNRWGNQVYASKDYRNDWNGNGLNEGTYYYLLRVKTSSEETKSFKGWVEILR